MTPRQGFGSELGLLWALGQPTIDARARPLRYRSFASLPYCPFPAAVTAPGLINRAHGADKLAKEAHAIINEAASPFGRGRNRPFHLYAVFALRVPREEFEPPTLCLEGRWCSRPRRFDLD